MGIRTRLISAIALVTMAAITLMGVFAVEVMEQGAFYGEVRKARLIAEFFKAGPDDVLADTARRLVGSGRLGSVEVMGRAGKAVFSSGEPGPPDAGRLIVLEDGVSVRHSSPGWLTTNISGALIASMDRGDSGRVVYTVPLDHINEELRPAKRFVLYFSMASALVIIMLAAYTLSRTIVGPIKDLEGAASRFSEGFMDERASLKGYGEIRSLAVSFNSMADSIEEKIRGIERVTKDLLHAQEKLLMSEKLATVGRLAAGIAHEVGNPLAALQGYLDMLKADGLQDSERNEMLGRVQGEISRIDAIVRDFLDAARPGNKGEARADVKGVLSEAMAILSAHRDFKDISIEDAVPDGLPRVVADPGRLKQVFINLLLNGAQAMSGRGAIKVRAGVFERHEDMGARFRRKTDRPLFSGRHAALLDKRDFIAISFIDNGPGIDDEHLGRIFDPFYTTKPLKEGAGLGLFVSREIVEAYGGEITVRTAKGEGTTFEVALRTA